MFKFELIYVPNFFENRPIINIIKVYKIINFYTKLRLLKNKTFIIVRTELVAIYRGEN